MFETVEVIVAIDEKAGISKEGKIPFNSQEDMKYFVKTTKVENSVVIVGRKTFEDFKQPLKNRINVVISSTMSKQRDDGVMVFTSLKEALDHFRNDEKKFSVFIAGGSRIYSEFLDQHITDCKKIHITRFNKDYGCDNFFPLVCLGKFPYNCEEVKFSADKEFQITIYSII